MPQHRDLRPEPVAPHARPESPQGDSSTPRATAHQTSLRVLSLFSGAGGLDAGLEQAGHVIVGMCENWEPARRVLAHRFPGVPVHADVTDFQPEGEIGAVAAGFPCTDLSHAGGRAGIHGASSGLVDHVFRIVGHVRPTWVLLENVPHLLALHRGAGMRYITTQLEQMGYAWAYRVVDSRFTGVPQRRPRVIILASRDQDPRPVLLGCDAGEPADTAHDASGFYWTEGRTGLGLVAGAVPTLKGGSMLGTPVAPAAWLPGAPSGRKLVLPTVQDGEALQGMSRGWTEAAVVDGERDLRWKLVGNAVTVGVGEWIGRRLAEPHAPWVEDAERAPFSREARWPNAGYGSVGESTKVEISPWPERQPYMALADLLSSDAKPLSYRATTGFLKRLDEVQRAVPTDFYADLEEHQAIMRSDWEASPGTRQRMSRQAQRNTSPERRLRTALWALGVRGYRLQKRPVPSLRCRMDIVYPAARVAVDVRGCFWHRCPEHGTRPRANAERWQAKLDANVARDDRHVKELAEHGWETVVVWEHEPADEAAARVQDAVQRRRNTPPAAAVEPSGDEAPTNLYAEGAA